MESVRKNWGPIGSILLLGITWGRMETNMAWLRADLARLEVAMSGRSGLVPGKSARGDNFFFDPCEPGQARGCVEAARAWPADFLVVLDPVARPDTVGTRSTKAWIAGGRRMSHRSPDLPRYLAWIQAMRVHPGGLMPKSEAARLLGVHHTTVNHMIGSPRVVLDEVCIGPGDSRVRLVPVCQVLTLVEETMRAPLIITDTSGEILGTWAPRPPPTSENA